MTNQISFIVNGTKHTLASVAGETLSTLLRQRLRLTGTKIGCDEAECGACTVLVDGEPIMSCVYPAERADGKTIVTIEGLADLTPGPSPTGRGELTLEWSIPALAQTKPNLCSTTIVPGRTRSTSRLSRRMSSTMRASLSLRAANSTASLEGVTVARLTSLPSALLTILEVMTRISLSCSVRREA